MKKILFLPIFIFLVILCVVFYKNKYVNLWIEFPKLRPQNEKVDVYYNGFKIGKAYNVKPCRSSSNVCVKVALKKDEMFLPDNLSAKMKQKRIHERKFVEYIEIIYPENPSPNEIRNDATIKGTLSQGFSNYLDEEVGFDEMENAKNSIFETVNNLQKITSIVVELTYSLNELLNETRKPIKETMDNISYSSKGLNSLTRKINTIADEEQLKDIIDNMEGISKNLNSGSENLGYMINEIEAANTINTTNNILNNTSIILEGIRCSLQKPFGGLRIMFGKTLE